MRFDPIEHASKIRDVLNAHPDLPIMVLAPSVPADYDSCYYDAIGADVEWVLQPEDVWREYKDYRGLDSEKFYTDEDDAVEDVAEWLFELWYDEASRNGMGFRFPYGDPTPADALTAFCGTNSDMGYFSENVARALVQDMPWCECVVIDCY